MAEDPSREDAPAPPRLFQTAIVLIFVLASALATHPYAYGGGDNRIAIPFLKAALDPGLYPGDYLLAERPYYYTYLWNVLGPLHRLLRVPLPGLFFGIYLAAIALTFFALQRIAMRMFGSAVAATLASVLLVFSGMTLGGIAIVDSQLTTRAVATAMVLVALGDGLAGRVVRAFGLLGLAYLIHPITTHFGLAMLVAVAIARGREGLRSLAAGVVLFLIVASPLLIWRLRHSPPSLHLGLAGAEWVRALRARSSHHLFPFSWGWAALAHAVAGLALFGITFQDDRTRDDRRGVHAALWALVAVCIAGTLFSELIPVGLVLVAQPLRAFAFVEVLIMAGVAHDFTARARHPLTIRDAVVAGLMVVWAGAATGPVALRLIGACVFVVIVLGLRQEWWSNRRAMVAMAAGVAVGGLIGCLRGDAIFSYAVLDSTPHLDVQRWAKANTNRRDAFIVPPLEPGEFRVEGERTIYADSEDGTLMNFDPAFGREWQRRMDMLRSSGPESAAGYGQLTVPELERIAREMALPGRRVFVLWSGSGRALPLPVRYHNAAYVVYEIPNERLASG
jgi:hypothetical protein